MKRIFIIVPIVFCIILTAFPIISVSAASYPNDLQTVTEMAESVDSRFKTLQECLLDLGNPDTYVYFRIAGIDGDDGDKMIYTYFSTLAVEGIDVTEEDNVYSFSYSSSGSGGLKFCRVSDYAYRNSDNWVSDQHAVTIGDPYSGNNAFISCSSCSLDLNTNKCSIIDDSYDEKYYIIGEPEIVVDGVKLNDDSLHVDVQFTPALSGEVDRSFTSGGNSGLLSNLTMIVTNHSRFAIQYKMTITRVPSSSVISDQGYSLTPRDYSYYAVEDVPASDDPVFIYYSSDWCYSSPADTPGSLVSDTGKLQMKGTSWHRIDANDCAVEHFDFSQINLTEGMHYIVTVQACRCDFDYASNVFVGLESSEAVYSDLYQLDRASIQTVYSSEFWMKQYKDVKYDPTNTKGGVIPYNWTNGISDMQHIEQSRDAIVNDDGSIDYSSHDFWQDHLDSRNSFDLTGDSLSGYSARSNTAYNKLLVETSSVFSFFTAALNLFPSGFRQIFIIGFWSILIISIIKVVR